MKATSPLLATAILLVATIAGGLILYNYILNAISAPKEYVTVTPIDASLIVLNNPGKGILNIKVSSIGTKSVKLTEARIYPNITKPIELNETIRPGETKSFTKEIDIVEKIDPDKAYYIVIYYDDDQATEPIELKITIAS